MHRIVPKVHARLLARLPGPLAAASFAARFAAPRRAARMEPAADHRDKRPKVEAAAAAEDGGAAVAAAAEAAPPAAAAAAPPPPPVAASALPPPPAKKAPPTPTLLPPPHLPADPAAWDCAVLLVDKPLGWTSFDVCAKLRGALGGLLRRKPSKVKVGHAGTLDPAATGLLVVCVGRGTKSVDTFQAQIKEYTGALRLGEATPSLDAETEVSERAPWAHVTDAALAEAAAKLTGEIMQTPPMYSAIRVGGERLYAAARRGEEVARAARPVTVSRFRVELESEGAQAARFEITCSKGTYVRTLAADLGAAVGSAAHLTALRRESIGDFRVGAAWQMADLAAALEAQRRAGAAARGEAAGAAAAARGAAPAAAATEPAAAAEPAVAVAEPVAPAAAAVEDAAPPA
jgi:tRNA pseudouridine55 synthase